MVSGSLTLLYFPGFHGGKQGSGPDRGQSPIEWGDFPSIRPSVSPSVLTINQLRGLQSQPGGPKSQLGGPQIQLGKF